MTTETDTATQRDVQGPHLLESRQRSGHEAPSDAELTGADHQFGQALQQRISEAIAPMMRDLQEQIADAVQERMRDASHAGGDKAPSRGPETLAPERRREDDARNKQQRPDEIPHASRLGTAIQATVSGLKRALQWLAGALRRVWQALMSALRALLVKVILRVAAVVIRAAVRRLIHRLEQKLERPRSASGEAAA